MKPAKRNISLFAILLVIATVAPLMVLAQSGGGTPSTADAPIKDFDGIIGLLEKAVTWLYTIFFILAVGFILWAAFLYLTAGEDSSKVDKAKKQLINAVIAIVIALVASGVAGIIDTFIRQ